MCNNPRKLALIENPSMPLQPKMRRSANATLTISIMALSFYICWTPYAVRCILAMVGVDLNAKFSGVSILISKLGVIVNPILYIFHNKEVSQKISIIHKNFSILTKCDRIYHIIYKLLVLF